MELKVDNYSRWYIPYIDVVAEEKIYQISLSSADKQII